MRSSTTTSVGSVLALATLIGCAQTPCEEAADLKASCVATGEPASDAQLPECAEESTEACVAACEIDREEDICAILDRTADSKTVQGYLDCLEACTAPPTSGL